MPIGTAGACDFQLAGSQLVKDASQADAADRTPVTLASGSSKGEVLTEASGLIGREVAKPGYLFVPYFVMSPQLAPELEQAVFEEGKPAQLEKFDRSVEPTLVNSNDIYPSGFQTVFTILLCFLLSLTAETRSLSRLHWGPPLLAVSAAIVMLGVSGEAQRRFSRTEENIKARLL